MHDDMGKPGINGACDAMKRAAADANGTTVDPLVTDCPFVRRGYGGNHCSTVSWIDRS